VEQSGELGWVCRPSSTQAARVPASLPSLGEPQKGLPCLLQVGALARRTCCLVAGSQGPRL